MTEFKVTNPNKWLRHMGKRYPDEAPGFDDVSNYIDDLRHRLGVARNHLDQVLGTATLGIEKTSDKGDDHG